MSNTEIFNINDGAAKALQVTAEFEQIAQDKGLDKFITTLNDIEAENFLMNKPELEPSNASQTALHMFATKHAQYEKQIKALGETREAFRNKISAGAYQHGH